MIPFLALGLGIAWIGITFIVIIREELRPSVARGNAWDSPIIQPLLVLDRFSVH